MTQSVKNIAYCLLFSTLAACAGGKDWPNLSDPLPDPAERNRVELKAVPVSPSGMGTSAPTTEAEAAIALKGIAEALPQELKDYRLSLDAFENSENNDERKDGWLDAQLKLTRLSRTLSELDPLIDGRPDSSAARRKALELKAFYEALVVEERQRLFRLTR